MRDDEYVLAVWERKMVWHQIAPGCGVINGFSEIYQGRVDDFPQPESAAWQAASAFTVSRLEEVRQLREEAVTLSEYAFSVDEILSMALLNAQRPHVGFDATVDHARICRILDRLNCELATLSAGLRPEILADLEKWIKSGEEANV